MVPMCAECQDILKKEADVRKLLYQQDKLLKAMHSQNDTNLRIAADLRKFSLVSALFESIERLLNEVNETLAMVNKNNESIRSAISQHMESCDSRVATVVTDINLSNCTLSQKINNLFEDRLTCLRNDMALLTRNTESLTTSINQASHQSTHDSQLREILEEVKFVSANLSGLKLSNTNDLLPNKTLEEELAEITQINEASVQPIEHQQQQQQKQPQGQGQTTAVQKQKSNLHHHPVTNLSPGWRFLGSKLYWRQDWSQYDAKQRTRRLQDKVAEKARRRRKDHHKNNNNNNKNNATNEYLDIKNNNKHTDKQPLDMAKHHFSGPPITTEHPIAALSVSSEI